jgi:hypothetical protein
MRIRIDGNCDAAQVVTGYLRSQGYLVSEHDPNYTIYLEEGETPEVDGRPSIVVDGIDCKIENRMIHHISHLTAARIVLARAGGVQSDQEIHIAFNHADTAAIEKGVFRGVLDTVGPEVAPAQPGVAVPPVSEAVIRSITQEHWSDFSTEVAGRIEKALREESRTSRVESQQFLSAMVAPMADRLAEIAQQLKELNSEFIIHDSELIRLLTSIDASIGKVWWRRFFRWKY